MKAHTDRPGATPEETTLTGTPPAPDLEFVDSLEPALTIAYHPTPELLGRRLLLSGKKEIVLGRGCEGFDTGVFDDRRISRRHTAFRVGPGGAVIMRDLGSHNGTYCNGTRTDASELSVGDAVGIGSVLLLYHLASRRREPFDSPLLVAESPAMRGALRRIRACAGRVGAVLVQGPTGTGKELVAREVHRASGRTGAFVALNCGAIPDGLLQSELFGHAKGGFSGADQARRGLVESAASGTLFLDEIGEASPTFQTSLLRLLEQREFRRAGDDAIRTTDAQFVAATNVDLDAAIAAGRFRADLYARIARYKIDVVALRERPDDIVPLAHAFVRRTLGRSSTLSAPLTLALLRYGWPLNVRELQAVIEQACLTARADEELPLTAELAARLSPRPTGSATTRPGAPPSASPGRRPRPAEADLRRAIDVAGGNLRALAAQLGIGRTTLYRWMSELGIDPRERQREPEGQHADE